MNELNLLEFDLLPWDSTVPGVRHKVVICGNKKIRLVEFGVEFVEPDWCTKGHISYVIGGEMEVEFDYGNKRFRAGDALFIPTGKESRHRHYATIQTTRLFLVEEN